LLFVGGNILNDHAGEIFRQLRCPQVINIWHLSSDLGGVARAARSDGEAGFACGG
jgi:hypothetical protein